MALEYDYIIAGSGCSGLSLAMHMIESGKLSDKRVLLIDKEKKNLNDRTWCFWEKDEGIFEKIVFKKWGQLSVHTNFSHRKYNIAPYQYKMIRGLDFYNYCLQTINDQPNFNVIHKNVDHIFSNNAGTGIVVENCKIYSEYVFNSINISMPSLSEKDYWIWQHFKGWIISTQDYLFDSSNATLMDFRVTENPDTSFCYLLPITENSALVEYTQFSDKILSQELYDKELSNYIGRVLKVENYKIEHIEFGMIPMTNYKFDTHQNNIIQVGTRGGQTKGSTGYTFNFIQKHSKEIVNLLIDNKKPVVNYKTRFKLYDSILLGILNKRSYSGQQIFEKLFMQNDIQPILKFLDNETTLNEELKIILTLPIKPFLKSALLYLF